MRKCVLVERTDGQPLHFLSARRRRTRRGKWRSCRGCCYRPRWRLEPRTLFFGAAGRWGPLTFVGPCRENLQKVVLVCRRVGFSMSTILADISICCTCPLNLFISQVKVLGTSSDQLLLFWGGVMGPLNPMATAGLGREGF